jgi:hypothetical protein
MARDDENPLVADVAKTQKAEPAPRRERPLRPAWQPLTWRGVAAFAVARFNRLLIAQTVVALLAVAVVLWFLDTGWFPILRDAIRQLPETGAIQQGHLETTRSALLAEHRLLTLSVNLEGVGHPNAGGDLRVEFRREAFALCSLFGCWSWSYPKDRSIPFNQPDLQSHWGAWETMIHFWAGLLVFIGLFLSWLILATIYSPMLRVYAFFQDRELSLAGSWKLAAAAMLPGALLVSAALVLYGLGLLDLPRFLAIWILHFFVGWAYLYVSPRRLPVTPDAPPTVRSNPFDTPDPPDAPSNPFDRGKHSPANSDAPTP